MRFKAIKSLKMIKYSSLIINRRRTQGNKQKSNNSTKSMGTNNKNKIQFNIVND